MAICGQLPDEEELEFIPVLFQNAVVVANPNMPLASQKSISLTDLKNYPIVSYRDSALIYYPFKELSKQYGFKCYQAFEDEVNGAAGTGRHAPGGTDARYHRGRHPRSGKRSPHLRAKRPVSCGWSGLSQR